MSQIPTRDLKISIVYDGVANQCPHRVCLRMASPGKEIQRRFAKKARVVCSPSQLLSYILQINVRDCRQTLYRVLKKMVENFYLIRPIKPRKRDRRSMVFFFGCSGGLHDVSLTGCLLNRLPVCLPAKPSPAQCSPA